MKVTQEEVVERQTILNIELEDEDLGPYLDRGYSRLVQRAAIPGFRKGKAPRVVVERYLGRESLLNEALEFMLSDVTDRAIDGQGLERAGIPKIELLELEPVQVKATVALTPEVDLGSYRDIRVEEQAIEITEEDVQRNLEGQLKETGSWEPVERPVKLGDMVTMAVVGTAEGNNVIDEKDAVYIAEKGSVVPFPGFADHLEGVEAGAPKEFTLTVSEDYSDAALAGKPVEFSLTVTDIKERKLPELDDEFAKGVGDGYETLDELREKIESDLKAEAERAQTTQYREATLDQLLSVATLELPPLLIEHEVEHMASRRDRFVDSLNISKDDYLTYTGKTEEQIREEMQEHALERLSRSYALTTLAEREGLEVSAEEIDERLQTIEQAGSDQGEVQHQHDLDSTEVRDSIRESLLVEKALDQLSAIARGDGTQPVGDEQEESAAEGGDTVDEQP